MNGQESVNEMTSMVLAEGLMTEDEIKRSSEDIAPDSNNTESEDLERNRQREMEGRKPMTENVKPIPLSRLNWNQNDDGLLWPYRDIDQKHVDSLVSLNEPQNWERIQVVPKDYHFNPNGYFWILDGQHRVMAAMAINKLIDAGKIEGEKIEVCYAVIRTDIKNDLQASQVMFEANLRHGKAPSFKEKKAHLEWLLEKELLDEDMTEAEIAAMVGLSQSTVHRVLNGDAESISRRDFKDNSRAFLRSLVKLHQTEGSIWTGNKMSGSFKKVLIDEMANDKEVNKAIHVLAKSLTEIVDTFDGK
jgi:predicted transcriptional regulator